MSKKYFFLFLCSFIVSIAKSQNPIVPAGTYIADPSARVWNDKLYIYGSLDESCNYYCSYRHHVMETGNLLDWKIYKNRFSSRGENDQVPNSDALLFAPDCNYKDGTYYLYFCMPDRKHSEGVAVSDSPTGPFTNGQRIDLGGHNQIDPSSFIDDDGQVYYVWGQSNMKMAKMKPNMKELDQTTIQTKILTEGEHHFHEGAYMTKRKGIYYLIYADISRKKPTSIGYAYSKKPFGPYTYGGVIVDNAGCNPGNWNNHGSIIEFHKQWYVLYHRSTHGCKKMRQACMEPIAFDAKGMIPEVEMTSQGISGPLKATETIGAERACKLVGDVQIDLLEEGNEQLSSMKNGDQAAYKYIDFGKGIHKIKLRVLSGSNGGTISIAIDTPDNCIGKLKINGTDDGSWEEVSSKIKKVKGIHALWFKFEGKGDDLFKIDSFIFE